MARAHYPPCTHASHIMRADADTLHAAHTHGLHVTNPVTNQPQALMALANSVLLVLKLMVTSLTSVLALGECTATKNATVQSQAKEALYQNSDLIIDGEKIYIDMIVNPKGSAI